MQIGTQPYPLATTAARQIANRLGIHRRGHSAGDRQVGAGWLRWGRHVSKHAWAYAAGVTLLLLGLTAPVLALQLGFPGEGSYPDSRTERRAFDLVADAIFLTGAYFSLWRHDLLPLFERFIADMEAGKRGMVKAMLSK